MADLDVGAPLISARGLAKSFPAKARKGAPVHAVNGVTFDVMPGEIVGLLGPNGAGKTTTMRMLTTLIRPTRGIATVAGYDLGREPVAVRRSIGYVSQRGSVGSEATAGNELVDHAALYGVSRRAARTYAEELLDKFQLPEVWDRPAKALSGGQRRRLDIALGLVHRPSLIFLDEPTTGLDPQARANLWNHISELRSSFGSTVFLTTHYLDEADALCDRVLIVDHGEIVADGSPSELKRQISGESISVRVELTQVAVARTFFERFPRERVEVADDGTLWTRVDDASTELPMLIGQMSAAGISILAAEVARPSLDDVFLELTGHSLRD